MAEGLAKHLESKGLPKEGADRLAEALQKAQPDADAAAIQVRHAARGRGRDDCTVRARCGLLCLVSCVRLRALLLTVLSYNLSIPRPS